MKVLKIKKLNYPFQRKYRKISRNDQALGCGFMLAFVVVFVGEWVLVKGFLGAVTPWRVIAMLALAIILTFLISFMLDDLLRKL